MTQYEPINWLREQAIRMRRIKWPNSWMLADELWLILSSLEPPSTGKVTINDDQDTDGNWTLPALNDLYIPPLDLDMPDAGTYQGVNDYQEDLGGEGGGSGVGGLGGQFQTTLETCFWHRSVKIGEIISESTTTTFPVRIRPNGDLANQCTNQWEHDPGGGQYEKEDTATCLGDPDNVEAGDKVLIAHIAQWRKEETTIRDKNTMAIIDKETELTRIQWANYFVPSAGGKDTSGTVAKTITPISAISDQYPGEGSMQRYRRNATTGALETYGSPVTVYSSVGVEVESGKWIQAKKIKNSAGEMDWWVDVEDCKDQTDGF